EGRAQGNVRQGEPAGRNRGVRRRRARMVSAGLRCLQRAAGREGVGPAAGAVRQGAGVETSTQKAKGPRTSRALCFKPGAFNPSSIAIVVTLTVVAINPDLAANLTSRRCRRMDVGVRGAVQQRVDKLREASRAG